jgi:hypothetical protein
MAGKHVAPVSGYTKHGHRIPGLIQIGKPEGVARCGGVTFCKECKTEARLSLEEKR